MRTTQYLGTWNLRIDLTRIGFEAVLYLPDKDFNTDSWSMFFSFGIFHLSYSYYLKTSDKRKGYEI